ncbi:hypothetical protein GLOIN_2v1874127 [Rhizophagus clarus]|uniref:Ion transport domain-containing protein n=1 Tax=Rhizophagus clarus TaxID=94130 RepID=A0A8H3MI12_9GLOM|nr:hypothetical protein GLOIN_2v1874127 [Rhizophagus clarus]
MSEKSDIQIEIENNKNGIDETGIDKPHNDNDKPPHKGKHISRIEVSPNEKYVVTYSKEDNSIVGWKVVDEGQLKSEFTHEIEQESKLEQLCVSDDKKLAYTGRGDFAIYDKIMDNYINLDMSAILSHSKKFNFNLKNEFVVFVDYRKLILIYSTQAKNNKWKCKRLYEIPYTFTCIGISKYDKVYFYSNNSIYELDILTKKNIKIFCNEEFPNLPNEDFAISSNKKFIFLKFNDKITIYSIELETSFALNDIQLNDFMCLAGLIPYLLPTNGEIQNFMEYCWKECLDRLKVNGNLPGKYQTGGLSTLSYEDVLRITDVKYAFLILDGYVWKIKLEEELDFSLKNSGNTKINKETYDMYKCLNIHLFNPYMDTIRTLFQEVLSHTVSEKNKLELAQNSIKWEIEVIEIDKYNRINKMVKYGRRDLSKYIVNHSKHVIKLQVFKKSNINNEWDLICTTTTALHYYGTITAYLYGIKLFNDNDVIILTSGGLFIYHFNENDNSIALNYYYYMDLYLVEKSIDILRHHKEVVFSKHTLPSPNFGVRLSVSSVNNENEESLLKYSVGLMTFAFEDYNSYNKPINYLCNMIRKYENKEIPLKLIEKLRSKYVNNRSTYAANIIADFIFDIYKRYIIGYDNKEFLLKHGDELLSLAIKKHELELIDWIYKECINHFRKDPEKNRMFLSVIVSKMSLLNKYYPEYITRYSIETTMITDSLSYGIEHQYNNLHLCSFQPIQVVDLTRSILWTKYIILYQYITTPTITFMVPYIKFVNYPRDYNWFLELIKPKSSPFIETISADIYNTWEGEALINFKWNTYGKYYYTMIWIGFIALLGCFTTAATIPQQYINDDIQKQLLIASIILGFIHLSFEVRQMIYNFKKWIKDFWNMFDLIAFLFPIIASIYWLQTNNMNVELLSFTCLFLDIKFLLFFRAFESFGVYFAIIISVGKQIISFLVVLLIIIISFAHAFYILLLPRSNFSFDERTINNDPNNPWNLAPSYNQVFENGTIDPNSFLIQPPNGNTNMFIDFRTSLFAMYKFLTGDSSALSNWTYTDNPSLAILIVLFSLLIVVYLMNLFIGLLNIAIDKDNNRVSYLILKAEILAEIELFYLLPHQRRWVEWFPEVIYYYANVDKTRKKIKEMMDKGEWNTNGFPEMKQRLLDDLNIPITKDDSIEATMQKILDIQKTKNDSIEAKMQKNTRYSKY